MEGTITPKALTEEHLTMDFVTDKNSLVWAGTSSNPTQYQFIYRSSNLQWDCLGGEAFQW